MRARFLRVRGEDGRLVATRAYFPARLDYAVRQKARWIHGISLQGWDWMGWHGSLAELWMRVRDRRGPLSALVLFAGYLLIVLGSVLLLAGELCLIRPWQPDPLLLTLIYANLASFVWRALMRAVFTAREYGWREGARAVLRIPAANVISIMATRQALLAYAPCAARHYAGTRPSTMPCRLPCSVAEPWHEPQRGLSGAAAAGPRRADAGVADLARGHLAGAGRSVRLAGGGDSVVCAGQPGPSRSRRGHRPG